LANIVSEINEPEKLPEGIIKQFVSGERMTMPSCRRSSSS
jgi:hypothetical protein